MSIVISPNHILANSLRIIQSSNNEDDINKAKADIYNAFESKVKHKTYKYHVYDVPEDIFQETFLQIFEVVNSIKDYKNPYEAIKYIIENIKPNSNTKKSIVRLSLDNNFNGTRKKLIDYIDSEKIPQVLSSLSPSQRARLMKRIEQIQSKANISESEKAILKERFGYDNTNGSTFDKIAENNNISKSAANRRVKSAILKIQAGNKSLPPEVKDFIIKFNEKFKKIPKDKVLEILKERPDLISMDIDIIDQRVKNIVSYFVKDGLQFNDYLEAAQNNLSMFYQQPETIKYNIDEIVKRFEQDGLTKADYLEAALKQPQLFTQSPDKIESNIKTVVATFNKHGLTLSKYLQAALNQPQLFYQSPTTVEKKIKEFVELFKNEGFTLNDYFKLFLTIPSVYNPKPANIKAKVDTVTETFKEEGLTGKKYLDCIMKKPIILTMAPRKVIDKIKICKMLTEDNFIRYGKKYDRETLLLSSLKRPFNESSERLYLRFLNRKITEKLGTNLFPVTTMKKDINNFIITHSQETFKFDVKDCEKAQEFTEFAGKLSRQLTGRNIFDITIV